MVCLARTVRIAAIALALSTSAYADDTILRLSETAVMLVTPDELSASMRAEAVAPSAQEAQRRVNEMMREALAIAKKADGIVISTGGYTVWRTAVNPRETIERWQAGQSLNVTGKDGEALLKLVGELQQRGLAQTNLTWRLSRETERKARKDATKQAISALRARAEDAAELLGLRFASFREVRLDSVSPPPMPRQSFAVARSAAGAAPPPNAESEDLPVSASAEADVVLKPR